MSLKTGTQARLVQPVVQGTITGRRINPDDLIEVCLEWIDADGNVVTRWFLETQLEAV